MMIMMIMIDQIIQKQININKKIKNKIKININIKIYLKVDLDLDPEVEVNLIINQIKKIKKKILLQNLQVINIK